MFPPLALLRDALVQHERAEAIIVLPWQRALSPAIAALLAALPVVQRVQLRGNSASMVKPHQCSAPPCARRGVGDTFAGCAGVVALCMLVGVLLLQIIS